MEGMLSDDDEIKSDMQSFERFLPKALRNGKV